MKGFYCFAMFAFCYILLMMLFQASAQLTPLQQTQQSPQLPGSGHPSPIGIGTIGSDPNAESGNSSDSALGRLQQLLPTTLSLDKLGITDPTVRQTLTNIYGSLLGQPECVKKSICITGNYMHDLPGRDIIFTLLSRYVPPEWGLLYDVFRVSVMYGQNCNVYFCTVEGSDPSLPVGVLSPSGGIPYGVLNQNQNQYPGGSAQQPLQNQIQNQNQNQNQNQDQHQHPNLLNTFTSNDNEIHKFQTPAPPKQSSSQSPRSN